jgi:SAM-dependent methyltransferase
MALADDATLSRSSVVVNNTMNRERQLRGRNSYARDLGFDPLEWIENRASTSKEVTWLDLCCGEGRALVETRSLASPEVQGTLSITGVDLLIDSRSPENIDFIEVSLMDWEPTRSYDLITCVHGLHYLGNKLGALERIARWLTTDGHFVANFDTDSLRGANGQPSRSFGRALRTAGFSYDARRHLISRDGYGEPEFTQRFLGADHRAGPNYTGQPAVHGLYDVG